MNENPYSAPSSSVTSPTDPISFELHEPRAVSVGNGVSWIGDGFELFKKDAGNWILICIVGFVLAIVLNLIPIVNMFSGVLTYVWIGGLMLGCKSLDSGAGISVSHLFSGFKSNFAQLLILGIVALVISVVIFAGAFGSIAFQMLGANMGADDPNQLMTQFFEDPLSTFVLPLLIAMLFYIPLMMMVWFAPALIVLNNVPVFKAMGMSFKGCLKNFVPYLIYGLVFLVLYIVALIPFGLGLLVVVPVGFASMYTAYKDIFIST